MKKKEKDYMYMYMCEYIYFFNFSKFGKGFKEDDKQFAKQLA